MVWVEQPLDTLSARHVKKDVGKCTEMYGSFTIDDLYFPLVWSTVTCRLLPVGGRCSGGLFGESFPAEAQPFESGFAVRSSRGFAGPRIARAAIAL